jgi:hypothetical protein
MAQAQMALPMDRRNGASAHRAPAPPVLPTVQVAPDPAPASVVEQAPVVERAPAVEGEQAPVVEQTAAVEAAPVVEQSAEAVPVWVRRVTTGAVVSVALVAVMVSFEHMRALAAVAGEGWRSWLLPISVDGLVVAGSMTMLVRRRAGQNAGALSWAALLLGLGVSVAANVAAADPSVIDPGLLSRLVAAWPPLALALSYELLMQQIKARGGPGVQPSAPVLPDPSNRRNP